MPHLSSPKVLQPHHRELLRATCAHNDELRQSFLGNGVDWEAWLRGPAPVVFVTSEREGWAEVRVVYSPGLRLRVPLGLPPSSKHLRPLPARRI